MTRNCETCEKGFYAKPADVRRGKSRFCSKRCVAVPTERRERISVALKERFKDNWEGHPQWKGEEAGYSAIHMWVRNQLGQPDECTECGKNGLSGHQIHWANLSGDYKRELSDWARMCALCHKQFDMSRQLV